MQYKPALRNWNRLFEYRSLLQPQPLDGRMSCRCSFHGNSVQLTPSCRYFRQSSHSELSGPGEWLHKEILWNNLNFSLVFMLSDTGHVSMPHKNRLHGLQDCQQHKLCSLGPPLHLYTCWQKPSWNSHGTFFSDICSWTDTLSIALWHNRSSKVIFDETLHDFWEMFLAHFWKNTFFNEVYTRANFQFEHEICVLEITLIAKYIGKSRNEWWDEALWEPKKKTECKGYWYKMKAKEKLIFRPQESGFRPLWKTCLKVLTAILINYTGRNLNSAAYIKFNI